MARARILFAWFVLAALSTLLICKVNLSSDSLFLDSVIVDIFHRGGTWHNWKITPAPAYFPDMVAYGLGYLIFPTPAERIAFVSVVQALLLAWACIRLAVSIRPTFSTNAKVLVLVIVSFVTLVSSNSEMWLFFNSTNNHFAALLFPILSVSFIFDFWKKKKRHINAVLLVVCVTLGTISTPVFILSFTLAALLVAIASFFFLRTHRQIRIFSAQIACLILLGHILASGLNRLLISFDAFSGRAPITLPATINSIEKFVAGTQLTYAPENHYTFLLALLGTAIIGWVIAEFILRLRVSMKPPSEQDDLTLKFFSDNWRYNLSTIFLLIVFPINVAGSIFSGGFADPWAYRYFSFPIALGWLLWIISLDAKGILARARFAYLGVLLLVLELAGGYISAKKLLMQSGQRAYADLAKSGVANSSIALGRCIDQEAKNGFVFDGGLADFWNSRQTMYASKMPHYILPVTNDLNPFFHMMTVGPLVNPESYGIKSYNFVILRRAGTETPFNLKPDTLGKLLPAPFKIVKCDNTDSELWLYKDLALDNEVKKRVSRFLVQIGKQSTYSLEGGDLPGAIGRVDSGARLADESAEKAGFLSYGPYMTIPAGRYKVSISYTATQPGNRWDAGRFNIPEKSVKLASGDFSPGERTVEFYMDTKDEVQDLEIRVWFEGKGKLTLNSITIQPTTTVALK